MFKVGEVVIFVGGPTCNKEAMQYTGMECTITDTTKDHGRTMYILDLPPCSEDGLPWAAPPEHIIKKKQDYDGNTLVSWNDIPYWKPKELARV